MNRPRIVNFEKKGVPEEGFLSIYGHQMPFLGEIKRVFWTYGTPSSIRRGRHAHFQTEMILISVKGEITVDTICQDGKKQQFTLKHPNEGLFIPKLCWHEMSYSEDAVQLVLCSTKYNESDYIRDFSTFENLIQ